MMATEEELQRLNKILLDIIQNNVDRYDELFKLNIIRETIKRQAQNIFQKTSLQYEDIKSVLRYIIYKDISSDNGFSVRNKKHTAKEFLARFNQIAYDRLRGNWTMLDDRKRCNYKHHEVSLDALGCPPEVLDENLVYKDFEKDNVSKISLQEFQSKLSSREKEVFDLRFKKDYTQQKIADILGISRGAVQTYQRRIINKYKHMYSIVD